MAGIYFQNLPFFLTYEAVLRSGYWDSSMMHSTPMKRYGRTVQLSADVKLIKYRVHWTGVNTGDAKIDCLIDKTGAHKMQQQLLDPDVNMDGGLQSTTKSTKKRVIKHEVEIERRRKIGLSNKGKTPWNKGQQHSQETREKIRRRTIEALRDPKVRKKMSESPHSHSEQSKAKISSKLKKVWEERSKRKKLQAKCYLTWAGVIAEAARKGSLEQQELEWDSFEKMSSEILIQHLQWEADRAREKEIAKRRAERAAKAKADKLAREVQEQRGEQKAKSKRSKEGLKQPEEKRRIVVPILGDTKLRARLAKIRRKQQPEGHAHAREAPVDVQPTSEKWDLEFIKSEKLRETVSFADQILALKREKIMGG